MMLTTNIPWIIRNDFSEALQFCAYIGEQCGFALEGEAQSAVEQAWREWWDICSRTTLATIQDAYQPTNPGDQGVAALQYIADRYTKIYDPPTFQHIENVELQAISSQHWPAFQTFWSASAKERYTDLQNAQLKRLDLPNLIGSVLRRTSNRREMQLLIDFVYWPNDYHAELTPSHLLLGARYLDARNLAELAAIVRAAAQALVE